MVKAKIFSLKSWQKVGILLLLFDLVSLYGSYFLALWFRFDCEYSQIPSELFSAYRYFMPYYAVVAVVVYWRLRLYNSMWQFASFSELFRCCVAGFVTIPLHIIFITLLYTRMPLSYYVFGGINQCLFILVSRFAYRFLLLEYARFSKSKQRVHYTRRGMLIGAGEAGRIALRDLNTSELSDTNICCIIDDDSNKWGQTIDNVPVVGGRDDILLTVKEKKIEQIFFAIPTATAADRKDLLNICKETGCELKTLPGVYQLANGEVTISQFRDVAVEDLLGRETITVQLDEILSQLSGKVIMVTGGGGSIGSELCRQIASHNPKQLIIFEVYENNAYDIEQELKRSYPELNLLVLIGSVRDSRRIEWVFDQYRPEFVYHAAAHKHVPLMETSPCEAIKNNVMGTYKTALAAMKYGCKRFVMISTDKAVNPTNIMGASKRLCEMVIQCMERISQSGAYELLKPLVSHRDTLDFVGTAFSRDPSMHKTEFVAVRFGNVLGSNGSVIPLFKKQILDGGPVTVTHPDIIRYFMTIPEAVSLVLQAGTYAKGGEIFVLDMGEPVKIDTLARNLIKLSGLKPDIDINVEYTGLRPGEKLYEEKLMDEEGLQKTPNKLIHIAKPIEIDPASFLDNLSDLAAVAYDNDREGIIRLTEKVTGTYRYTPKGDENKTNVYFKELGQDVPLK